MAHEKSETIQLPGGKWVNVYGKGTDKAGQKLPDELDHDTVDSAVDAAKERSRKHGERMKPEPAAYRDGGKVKMNRALGIPRGQKIPAARVQEASRGTGKAAQHARLALSRGYADGGMVAGKAGSNIGSGVVARFGRACRGQ
jgi:hypothetical protein